jgi:hypothetical protein
LIAAAYAEGGLIYHALNPTIFADEGDYDAFERGRKGVRNRS